VGESTRIKIGAWTATPALNLLERGTRQIKIEPRAMDVLVVLARHDGAVVSVEQLIASVWKGLVVGDGSVYLAIRQLRQALHDSADSARYIETIPKRGYRLTVPVALESTPAQTTKHAPARRPTERPLRLWLGTACAGAVIVAGAVSLLRDDTQPKTETSVAVLPFQNLSSDAEQAYFADGVTAEILNGLARVRDLRVTGPVPSFQFKDRNEEQETIAATLGVEHLLQGSVRKAGDHLRIAAHLSNARTGEQLWSETYERGLDDVFLIQDEIAKAVASALQVKLGVGDVGRVPGMTRNVAAYDEYLRGVARDGRPESFPLGIAHLQRAVALDPSYSVAWVGLGMAYANGALVVPERAEEWERLGDDALERARSLTPDAPHVLLSSVVIETRRGHWLEAARMFERLEASYSRYGMSNRAWGARGTFLAYVGRLREATPVLERARAEDPLASGFVGLLTLAYTARGDYTAALAEVDRGLALEGPDTPFLRTGLLVAFNKGDRVEIDERMRALPDIPPRLARLVHAPGEAAAEIRQLASGASPSVKTALAHWAIYFHEPELALELWSEGTRDPDGLWAPLMRDVRKLPAFKEVVRDLGLVDYWRAYGWSDFCHPTGDEDFACG
jgi:TolB-like protein/DNA-binding winged helix-turn-helix (wHTH) protein